MLERLQRIATHLKLIKRPILGIGFISLAIFLASLLGVPGLQGDFYLILSIIVFCWAGAFFAVTELFISVPPVLTKPASWRARLAVRVHRLLLWLVAGVLGILSLLLVVLTYQLLRSLL